jgi:ABC-type phosphate transport system ATPase subunit
MANSTLRAVPGIGTKHTDVVYLVEFGDADDFFTNPKQKRTEDYITGRCG